MRQHVASTPRRFNGELGASSARREAGNATTVRVKRASQYCWPQNGDPFEQLAAVRNRSQTRLSEPEGRKVPRSGLYEGPPNGPDASVPRGGKPTPVQRKAGRIPDSRKRTGRSPVSRPTDDVEHGGTGGYDRSLSCLPLFAVEAKLSDIGPPCGTVVSGQGRSGRSKGHDPSARLRMAT
jgi:hypothetical protein